MLALFKLPICLRTTQILLLQALRGGWSYNTQFFGLDGFQGPCDNGCAFNVQCSLSLFLSASRAFFFSLDEPPSQPRHVVDTYNLCAIVLFYGDISHLEESASHKRVVDYCFGF